MKTTLFDKRTIKMEGAFERISIRIPDCIVKKLSNTMDTKLFHSCEDDFMITTKADVKEVTHKSNSNGIRKGKANATFIFNGDGLFVFVDLCGISGYDENGQRVSNRTEVINMHFSRHMILRMY